MATVALQHVTKKFTLPSKAEITAVNQLDLTVGDGEFLVLLGPSGCGKTTTLRLIAGLDEPTSGTVLLDGSPVSASDPRQRNIGMVFQHGALYPHMTAFENIAFGLKVRGWSRPDRHARVDELASALGLEQCLDRRPSELSGGQRQRVALARALARKPSLLLFDEPLSNLDPTSRDALRSEIVRMRSHFHATAIYVTHDQEEAMALGDRIAVLQEGRLRQCAAPLDLYRAPANTFVATFIGSPPMNLLTGDVVRKDGATWLVGSDGLELHISDKEQDLPAGPVRLGLRPEDISIADPEKPCEGKPAIIGRVVALHPLGSELRVTFSLCGGLTVTARLAPDTILRVGDQLPLSFNTAKACLFDAISGESKGRVQV